MSSSFLDTGGANSRRAEELLEQYVHAPGHLRHEKELAHAVQSAVFVPGPFDVPAGPEIGGRGALGRRISTLLPQGSKSGAGGGRNGGTMGRGKLSLREHSRRGSQGLGHGGTGSPVMGARASETRGWGRECGGAGGMGGEGTVAMD